MFQKSLYTIENILEEDSAITANIRLNPDNKIYEGHFPDLPVTPGVVQMQIVKEILEKHLNRKFWLKSMKTCKFLQIIDPFVTPNITIEIKYSEGELLDVVASGVHGEVVFFKMQSSYR